MTVNFEKEKAGGGGCIIGGCPNPAGHGFWGNFCLEHSNAWDREDLEGDEDDDDD